MFISGGEEDVKAALEAARKAIESIDGKPEK
jgi:hypothetical protein